MSQYPLYFTAHRGVRIIFLMFLVVHLSPRMQYVEEKTESNLA